MNYQKINNFIQQNKGNSIKLYTYQDINNIPNGDGIYIMFEDGQKDHQDRDRIIRIGKAVRGGNGFRERIKNNHFNGKITNSVFRKHIALSLLNAFYLGKNTYIKQQKDIEKEVNDFIQRKICFILLKAPKNEIFSVEELESALIYTFAQEYSRNKSRINKDWLGNYSLNSDIINCKMWNSDHTKKQKGTITPQKESAIEQYVTNPNNY